MKKYLFKNVLLLILPLTLAISSCSGVQSKPSGNELGNSSSNIDIDYKDFEEMDFDGQELKEVKVDNPNLYNNTFRDVAPDFSFELKGISRIITETSFNGTYGGLVTVTDSAANVVNFSGNLNSSNNRILIQSASPYESGKVYTATLNDDTLQFHVGSTLHESIREIYFSVKEEDKNVLSLKEGIRTLPLDNVLSNSKDPLEPHKSLLYKGSIEVAQDEVIKFVSDDQARIDDTLYIKVSSFKAEDGNTRIYYDSPEVDEVLNDLDVHVDDKPLECNENNFHLADKEQIYNDLLYSEPVLDYVALTALKYNFADNNSVVDFFKSCNIAINFKFIDGGISLQAIILFKHKFESDWLLTLNITLEWQETYRISADAEVRTVLGVPVGVDMSMSSSKTDKLSVKGSVIFSHSTFNPGPDWYDPESLDLSDAKEAVQQLKDNWASGGMFSSKRERTESGVTLFNIGWVDFYFGYATVSVEFYLYLTSAVSITLGFGYTYENTTTMVNFSTSEGNKGGSASPSNVSSHVIDVDLVGKYYLEFGLKVRFSVYITGLRWIIALQVDLEAGLYFNFTGFGGFVANLVTGDINLDIGFLVEIGFVLRVTLSVILFKRGYGNWQIWSLQKPLISFGNVNRIEDRVDETVNLTKPVTKIDNTNLMKFTVFDGSAMLSTVKTFKFKEELTIADSVFWDEPISRKFVTNIVSKNPEYITIQDDSFVVSEGAPKLFDATIELTVDDLFAAFETTYTVKIHYQQEGTKVVTFDGANSMAYEKGEVIDFPVVKKDGQIFKGWQLNGQDVDLSKPYIMGDEDLNFTSRFIPDVSFLVSFYDGHNNLVSSGYVQNEEAAVEPEASIRDAKMEGYVFIGWDTDISCIKQDTIVHGIYVKVEEVNQ